MELYYSICEFQELVIVIGADDRRVKAMRNRGSSEQFLHLATWIHLFVALQIPAGQCVISCFIFEGKKAL